MAAKWTQKGGRTHLHQVDPCTGQLAGSILPEAPVKAAQQLLRLHQGDPAQALVGDSLKGDPALAMLGDPAQALALRVFLHGH